MTARMAPEFVPTTAEVIWPTWHLVPSWDRTRTAVCGIRVTHADRVPPVRSKRLCRECQELWAQAAGTAAAHAAARN